MTEELPASYQPVACPFIGIASDPATHFTFPDLSHRCGATRRQTPVEPAHQSRYCLTADHADCPRFRQPTGRAAGESVPAGQAGLGPGESVPAGKPPPSIAARASRLIGGLLVLAVLAGAGLYVARIGGVYVAGIGRVPSGPAGVPGSLASASASPSPAATPQPSPSPAASALASSVPPASPGATPAARRSPRVSASPTRPPAQASPTGRVVHVVRVGDTLTSLAQEYGVTIEAIVRANGLADANRIDVGQRLVIPAPQPSTVP